MAGYIGSKAVLLSTTAAVVTGTITSDGLTVEAGIAQLELIDTGVSGSTKLRTANAQTWLEIDPDNVQASSGFSTYIDGKQFFQISSTGDVSFYEDTGTTPKFFWDASAESLGIGTSSPSAQLHQRNNTSGINAIVENTTNNTRLQILSTGSGKNSELWFGDGADDDVGRIDYDHGNDSLSLYTATAERLRIDSSGNVGIGVTDPDSALEVQSSASGLNSVHLSNTSSAGYGAKFVGGGATATQYIADFRDYAGASKVKIDGSGNVGINTASPGEALHVIGTIQASANFQLTANDSYCGFSANGMYVHNTNDIMSFKTGAAERLRIDASGNVLVGMTAASWTTAGQVFRGTSGASFSRDGYTAAFFNRGVSNGVLVEFQRSGSSVGNIEVTASATAYNTSSDYRLKENVTPIQGAADTVMAMQPCTYTAIVDGVWYDGFLAHELQEVHPRAVQGTKDAMMDEEYEVTPAVYEDVVTPAVDAVAATYDDEGLELTPAVEAAPETTESALVTEAVTGTRSVPDMQSVDYSKLTPILTAALQEALTEIAALKVRVAALEVTP